MNNEFYVCPVYSGALAEGKNVRILDCDKFWGVGVPLDYMAFLDKFTPPDLPRHFRSTLARKYEGMWCKWGSRLPVPQPTVTTDPTLCAAMWCTGSFLLTSALEQLKEALAPWAHKFSWYGLPGSGDMAPQTVLHHTFFQFHTFPVSEADSVSMAGSMAAWAGAAQASLSTLPPYHLEFIGVAPVRSGIVMCGFPPMDYTPARTAIRAAAACVEPHAQDVHHVSLLRWTADLTVQEYQAVCSVLERFRSVRLGMLQPDAWTVGYGTWSMRPETLRPVHTWTVPNP